MMDIKAGLTYGLQIFDKKCVGSSANNEKFAEELPKPIIRNF